MRLLLLTFLVMACQGDERPGTEGISRQDVVERDDLIGATVSLRGRVGETYGSSGFVLADRGVFGGEAVVVLGRDLAPGGGRPGRGDGHGSPLRPRDAGPGHRTTAAGFLRRGS